MYESKDRSLREPGLLQWRKALRVSIGQRRHLGVKLLILQGTPFCNIACDYCYLANRTATARMSPRVARAAYERLRDSGLLGPQLSVVWHAGEPLVLPRHAYVGYFESAKATLSSMTELTHCIQTNGILIDSDWCDLFAEWRVRIGVSLDGPAFVHDRHRVTRAGKPTHALVMRGIDTLREHNIPFHVIAVVTRDSLPYAREIMEFFIREGISQVGFNIDEREGVHDTGSLAGEEPAFERFLEVAFEAASAAPFSVEIREFRDATQRIVRGLPEVRIGRERIPYNSQVIAGEIISVATDGSFSTYSPELLDQHSPDGGNYIIGNVLSTSLRDALDSPRAQDLQRAILSGVQRCAETCEFYPYCGGGAPANKLAETAHF